ncbi:MAG TPA: MATE family efflux transporter, partial [Coriobacteriia bacterium]|nr:MATE family efflux transporter [Coriobacteriia bacterium]
MSQEMAGTNPLGTQRISKLMLRFAVPSIVAMIVTSLYNMIDQIFIGQGVGYLGNAATNIILPFSLAIMAVALMIGDGTAAFMSLSLGRGDSRAAARGVGNAVIMLA